jgi:hypothetical protein
MLSTRHDACGHLVYDYLRGLPIVELVERDDGWIAPPRRPRYLFCSLCQVAAAPTTSHDPRPGSRPRHWLRRRPDSLVPSGEGTHCPGRGQLPLAVRTARLRGVRQARVRGITELTSRLGVFGTILLLGSNSGLLANPKRARWLLGRFRDMTANKGRIISEILDPYDTTAPEHRRYHRQNRRRGRMAGQVRIRVRYKVWATHWFDCLFVSQAELRSILKGTGWRVERIIRSNGPTYMAILARP